MTQYTISDAGVGHGYLVVSPQGLAIATHRTRGRAMDHVAELNGKLRIAHEHTERFYAEQAREFIRRTT